MDWYPLLNSLRIAAISTVVVFFLGIAAAHWTARLPRAVMGALDVALTLPLVLPPTVVGWLLLLLLGPKRPAAGHDLAAGHLRHCLSALADQRRRRGPGVGAGQHRPLRRLSAGYQPAGDPAEGGEVRIWPYR